MSTIRYLTAGESHGKALVGILEGIPAGLELSSGDINADLKRRQGGHGRGGRMKIESDHVEILSGVRWGRTIGAPIAFLIENKDYRNWQDGMSPDLDGEGSIPPVTKPRPGHADLAGAMKYRQTDIRNVLERSSARETAMRVGLGAVAKKFLGQFGIRTGSYVLQIGSRRHAFQSQHAKERELLMTFRKAEKSPVRCADEKVSREMVALIDRALRQGNSVGGVFEVFVTGLPPGIGSHMQWDTRLDGRLAQALMSIQAIKGVEVGQGFTMSGDFGSAVMDQIYYRRGPAKGFFRKTNFAGGIEGGMTNGMPVLLRAAMKPIPTQRKPLASVDITKKKSVRAAYERSDICAVPAAGVIGEAMTALCVCDAFLGKFGGDSMDETKRNYDSYLDFLGKF
jgi:chorismate synthase